MSYTSPVQIPVGAIISPQRGNLTGVPRKIRDNCAEWHNLIQQWNSLNISGSAIIESIMSKKLNTNSDSEALEEISAESVLGLSARPEVGLRLELQELCESLQKIFDEMVRIFEKMKQVTLQFEGQVALQEFQHSFGADGCLTPLRHQADSRHETQVVFRTLTVENFAELSKKMLEMYTKEIKVKENVLESVAHASGKDQLLFLSSVWIHEPYIRTELALYLESILTETGHRYPLQ